MTSQQNLPFIQPTALIDVKIINPVRHKDRRGFFSESYGKDALLAAGIDIEFVQDNHVLSEQRGTVRGLHFQVAPFAQAKLVRVIRGSIFDVVVDIRNGSPTYGEHVTAIISAERWNQILVPVGFAHGLITLEPNTEVLYKVSQPYSPEHDKGILWDDPQLGIDWPISGSETILSEKDKAQPQLSKLPIYFKYENSES